MARVYDKDKKQIGVKNEAGKIFYFDPDYEAKQVKKETKKPVKKKDESK